MKSFPVHFTAHVKPQLRNLAEAEAVCIVHGVETWGCAFDAVMRHARQRGAMHLPIAELEDLEDWIAITLLAEIDRAEQTTARR